MSAKCQKRTFEFIPKAGVNRSWGAGSEGGEPAPHPSSRCRLKAVFRGGSGSVAMRDFAEVLVGYSDPTLFFWCPSCTFALLGAKQDGVA